MFNAYKSGVLFYDTYANSDDLDRVIHTECCVLSGSALVDYKLSS